ncbi:MAG: hypothetical protein AB1512_01580 [Thermodesulfobacteriota bacterium]
MRLFVKMLGVGLAVAALTAAGTLPGFAQEKIVRAKLGIAVKSGKVTRPAKSRDNLKAGDTLRIYVHPEESSYVYVVHTDGKSVSLLNMVEQRVQGSTLVLPSVQEYYAVDGKSEIETFTIVCSPEEVKQVWSLVHSQMTPERWDNLQRELLRKGEMDLVQKKVDKPFSISGTVRSAGDGKGVDPFVKELKIFSGKSMVVKQYEFHVKN